MDKFFVCKKYMMKEIFLSDRMKNDLDLFDKFIVLKLFDDDASHSLRNYSDSSEE